MASLFRPPSAPLPPPLPLFAAPAPRPRVEVDEDARLFATTPSAFWLDPERYAGQACNETVCRDCGARHQWNIPHRCGVTGRNRQDAQSMMDARQEWINRATADIIAHEKRGPDKMPGNEAYMVWWTARRIELQQALHAARCGATYDEVFR